jgi:predicted transcriptional regulator
MQRPAIHVRVHPDIRKRLGEEAEAQHLDMSAIVTVALNQYFAALDVERRRKR